MSSIRVRPAHISDRDEIAKMCALLWPDASAEEHGRDIGLVLNSGKYGALPATIFVSSTEDDALTGFLQVGLRSHADGCDPSHPVGFIEGWFVYEPLRGRGIGKALMRTAEDWSRSHGCIEIASDTWIDHMLSQKVHEAVGFQVVDRCVHFRKPL